MRTNTFAIPFPIGQVLALLVAGSMLAGAAYVYAASREDDTPEEDDPSDRALGIGAD